VTKEKPSVQEVELWRVQKDARELRCVVRYMPHGLDLRLRRTAAGCFVGGTVRGPTVSEEFEV
jgi:hypothetical protein